MPQVSVILDMAQVIKKLGIKLIADGGIKFSSNVVKKAMAAGSKDCYAQADVHKMDKLVPEAIEGAFLIRESLSSGVL